MHWLSYVGMPALHSEDGGREANSNLMHLCCWARERGTKIFRKVDATTTNSHPILRKGRGGFFHFRFCMYDRGKGNYNSKVPFLFIQSDGWQRTGSVNYLSFFLHGNPFVQSPPPPRIVFTYFTHTV